MELQKTNVPFLEVHVCDTNNQKLLSTLEIKKPIPLEMIPFMHSATAGHCIALTDFHRRRTTARFIWT